MRHRKIYLIHEARRARAQLGSQLGGFLLGPSGAFHISMSLKIRTLNDCSTNGDTNKTDWPRSIDGEEKGGPGMGPQLVRKWRWGITGRLGP